MLGPVEMRSAGGWSGQGTPQQRLLLALLALRAGQVVPVDELIDTLWEARPPRSARASLQALVTRLRKALAGFPGGGLERCGEGYRLMLEPELVDVHRFRSLAKLARQAPESLAAAEGFGQALAMWRGPALADLPATGRVEAIRSQLTEEQLTAAGDRASCLLSCGREREAAAELPALLAAFPLAERLAALFMTALYRCGQRADALRVFRETRGRLAGELGVEPGPELQRLHQCILSGDPDPARTEVRPAAARPVLASPVLASPMTASPLLLPRQLPAAPPHFAGRTEELATLDKLATAGGVTAVWAIVGNAGTGKTALAVHWAHQASDDFPDGQLYIDLKGFSPGQQPVPPGDALRGFLHALGARPPHIPDSLAAQTGLYRSLLAGKRVLIVCDNAKNAAQVRPLLPGDGTCPVLITSRNRLTGLAAAEGAQLVGLDVLPGQDAYQLLSSRLGQDRLAAEPAAAAELVRLCAGLPLALVGAAALVAFRPEITLAALAAELRRRNRRRQHGGTVPRGPLPRGRLLPGPCEPRWPAALPGT
jgi:DNA-binding SARP family transcriptional activator